MISCVVHIVWFYYIIIKNLGDQHWFLIGRPHLGRMMLKLSPIVCKDYTLRFEKTLIMGILNVTPDSFSDGGLFADIDTAVAHGKKMVSEGADVIDVGGESSRPGSAPLSEKEELDRILPVVTRLLDEVSVPISIDTYKPLVADACLKAGAHLINDITGLTNPEMRKVAVKHNIPVVLMHMRGTPKTMQQNPVYQDLLGEITAFFQEQIATARKAGIQNIIIDPGIGFGKTVEHNLQILKHLGEFKSLGCPILVGPSRKSFIGMITGLSVKERLDGTLAAIIVAVMNGANMVRVHDVNECKRAVQVADAIRGA
jgi:dihydropteroate synthase